jgi:hypothetical protein
MLLVVTRVVEWKLFAWDLQVCCNLCQYQIRNGMI